MHLLASSLTAQLGGKDTWKHSFSQDAVGLGCSGSTLLSAQPASFQRANPALDPLPPQAPAFMGAALPGPPGLSEHPDSLLQAQPRQPRKHHRPFLPLTAAQLHCGGMWRQPTGHQPETGHWAWRPGSDESRFHRGSDQRTGGLGVCTVTRA